MNASRRVVITACGAVLPPGKSPSAILNGLRQDFSPFERSAHDPETAVLPVPDFNLKKGSYLFIVQHIMPFVNRF